MNKYIILRADDLGFSEAVNYGIEKTVKRGPVRTVGVMVNMDAAEHGLRLLEGSGCCLGLHVSISAGRPVCSPDQVPSLVDAQGVFYPGKKYRTEERFADDEDLYREITAQYRRFVELLGRKPSYFEVHAIFSRRLESVMQRIAKEFGLLYQAPFAEMTVGQTPVYMCAMSAAEEGYNAKDAFKREVSAIEDEGYHVYVCHPGYLDRYLWTHSSMRLSRMEETDMLCDPELTEWMKEQNVKVVTYDDLGTNRAV